MLIALLKTLNSKVFMQIYVFNLTFTMNNMFPNLKSLKEYEFYNE